MTSGNGKTSAPEKEKANRSPGHSRDDALMYAVKRLLEGPGPPDSFDEDGDPGPGFLASWWPPLLKEAFREWIDGEILESTREPEGSCWAEGCHAYIDALQLIRVRLFGDTLKLVTTTTRRVEIAPSSDSSS